MNKKLLDVIFINGSGVVWVLNLVILAPFREDLNMRMVEQYVTAFICQNYKGSEYDRVVFVDDEQGTGFMKTAHEMRMSLYHANEEATKNGVKNPFFFGYEPLPSMMERMMRTT